MSVLVVGAGISGLTLATALAQAGVKVDLIERNATIADQGGVGLTIVSNAMRALDTIGVAGACIAGGNPSDVTKICSPDGAVLAAAPQERFAGPAYPAGTGISRALLHSILAEAALDAGVRPLCGTICDDWSETGSSLIAALSNGERREYDLLVGADGIHSSIRRKMMPHVPRNPTGQAVWRADTRRPEGLNSTHLYVHGPAGLVGICPIAPDRSYLYIVEPVDEAIDHRSPTLHLQMQERLAGYGGYVGELAAEICHRDLVDYRRIDFFIAPRPWSRGRAVLIGDAAHTFPPVLAQGAAMGIEDAIVLASELKRSDDVPAALARFTDRRFDRVKATMDASCQLARWEVESRTDVDIAGVVKSNRQFLAALP